METCSKQEEFMGGVGLGPTGVLPPQNFDPEVTYHAHQLNNMIGDVKLNYLSILLSVDDCSLHITLSIAGIKGKGLTAHICLTTSL